MAKKSGVAAHELAAGTAQNLSSDLGVGDSPDGPKTGDKSGRMVSPVNGASCPTGNHPGNTGGKKGRSGRKPQAWRDACRQALDDGKADVVLAKIISGDVLEALGTGDDGQPVVGATKNSDRLGAIKLAAAYAEGLPIQPSVDLTPPERKRIPVVAILAALRSPEGQEFLAKHPDRAAQVKMLEAIEAQADIVS